MWIRPSDASVTRSVRQRIVGGEADAPTFGCRHRSDERQKRIDTEKRKEQDDFMVLLSFKLLEQRESRSLRIHEDRDCSDIFHQFGGHDC
jgi:hypothetical protein